MEEIRFTVPVIPITKKNHQRILVNSRTGKHFISASEEYKRYERAASLFVPVPEKPIWKPVEVTCLFYMPTRRRVDLTNLLEAIDDVMVNCGLLDDDNSKTIVSHDGSRVFYDKEHPRTEVIIRDYPGDERK